MCLIVTILMMVFAMQSFMLKNWAMGAFQLAVALGFLALLIRNIRITRYERDGNCNSCMPTWLSRLFSKKEE